MTETVERPRPCLLGMPAPIEALSAEEVAGVEALVREAGLLR